MPLTDSERSAKASIAALTRALNEPDRSVMTEKARSTFKQSFYDNTDPELPADERKRLADMAYKLHMKRLSYRASVARTREAEARRAANLAEADHLAAVAKYGTDAV